MVVSASYATPLGEDAGHRVGGRNCFDAWGPTHLAFPVTKWELPATGFREPVAGSLITARWERHAMDRWAVQPPRSAAGRSHPGTW